jgi:7,8-dihydropterin-6-yl-methyl-4-(beta-D-ribofuranosyl)aminobenzene 5'-phosphate synthase
MCGEWGLSLLINYNGKKILVDAGSSELFLTNMKELGEEVEDVDYAVLSHAHYDHANGFPYFFANNSKAKLFVRETTAADCYDKEFIFKKYIGIPKKMLKDFPDRIETVTGTHQITEGVYLVPHSTKGLIDIGKREKMYRKLGLKWVYDDFSHEQSLVLDTDKGLLIINSCSHGGVINILNEVKAAFPDKKIYGYIGGFHLFNKTNEEVLEVASAIKNTSIDYICTGHCTRGRAFKILKEQLGDRIEQMQVGMHIEI